MKRMWNNFIVGFLNGIAILTPLIVTVLIIKFLVMKLNEMLLNPLVKFMAPLQLAGYEVLVAKTIILFSALALVVLIGWGTKVWIIRRTFIFGERLFVRIPFMGRIYNAIKHIISTFANQGKGAFRQVVLVEFPRKGVYSMGFVTGAASGEIKAKTFEDGIHVFVPTAPNPTTGFFLILSKNEVTYLDISVEDGIKLVISGGVVNPAVKDPGIE